MSTAVIVISDDDSAAPYISNQYKSTMLDVSPQQASGKL